jgi:hypothetical protein
MQFILDNGIYKVARITGPQHNFLGVHLGKVDGDITIEELSLKNGERNQIEKSMVLSQVFDGLREINDQLGKNYSISQIFFVPSDSPSASVYKFLTIELIKRIDSNGTFLVV